MSSQGCRERQHSAFPPGPSALNSAIPDTVAPVAEGRWWWKAPLAMPFPIAVL